MKEKLIFMEKGLYRGETQFLFKPPKRYPKGTDWVTVGYRDEEGERHYAALIYFGYGLIPIRKVAGFDKNKFVKEVNKMINRHYCYKYSLPWEKTDI